MRTKRAGAGQGRTPKHEPRADAQGPARNRRPSAACRRPRTARFEPASASPRRESRTAPERATRAAPPSRSPPRTPFAQKKKARSGAQCELLVKLDSDTALFRPEAWTTPAETADVDFTYLRRYDAESRLLANGCAYAVSRRALLQLKNFYSAADKIPAGFAGNEDMLFSAFWTALPRNRDLTLCQLSKDKFHWCAKPYYDADCLDAHLGYVSQEEDFARRRGTAERKNA